MQYISFLTVTIVYEPGICTRRLIHQSLNFFMTHAPFISNFSTQIHLFPQCSVYYFFKRPIDNTNRVKTIADHSNCYFVWQQGDRGKPAVPSVVFCIPSQKFHKFCPKRKFKKNDKRKNSKLG